MMIRGPLSAALVIALGSLNSVSGRIRSKPLGSFDYFTSLFNAAAYTAVYFLVLGLRTRLGYVGKDQFAFVWKATKEGTPRSPRLHEPLLPTDGARTLRWRWRRTRMWWWVKAKGACSGFTSWWRRMGAWRYFMLTGFCDAWGNILGFIAQPYISGALFSLMTQSNVPFTAVMSIIILKRKYGKQQVLSVCLVLFGASIALVPQFIQGPCAVAPCDTSRAVGFALLTALSTLPNAISYCVKEKMFRAFAHDKEKRRREEGGGEDPHGRQEEGGDTLDLFIVNSHGSLFQLFFVPLALPINLALGQTHGESLARYVHDGLSCAVGRTPPGLTGCEAWGCCTYAPQSYAAYLCVNLAFNVALLAVLKYGSALLGFVCLKGVLPTAVLLFSFVHWPLLRIHEERASPWIYLSLGVVLAGVVWFRAAPAPPDPPPRRDSGIPPLSEDEERSAA